MKHLGDITKINGAAVEPVEVIIGGSPCQDLSVAGKRAGLNGERSGLFMEQIRIIKEMRSADERNEATHIRPRYMVWENVPGAFSSNKGEDFRVVLEETARVCEPSAVIPRPEGGKWTNAGAIMGDGWSIAWRVHDAQFWGVPQRRRRIALVADFGGESAPEILFERESVSGDITQSGTPWKDFAAFIAKRFGGANQTEREADHLTYCIQGNSIDRADTAGCNGKGVKEGVSYTLNTIDRPAVYDYDRRHGKCQDVEVAPTVTAKYGTGGGNTPLVYDARGNGEGRTVPTITGDHQNRVTDYTALAVGFPLGFRPENTREYPEKATTICNGTRPGSCNGVIINFQNTLDCAACDLRSVTENYEVNGTLQSRMSNNLNSSNAVRIGKTIRRLTPLECERLQGFPDGWTDIGDYIDTKGKKRKTSDSARYKALGNSIALPFWAWLLNRLNKYCAEHTMASLFDGIGGFPLIWGNAKRLRLLCLGERDRRISDSCYKISFWRGVIHMMTKLKEQVTRLVDFELEMANKEHGERFNSAHEAYAVMKEEYEEARDNFCDVDILLNQSFWDRCKCNENGVPFAESIKSEAINAACECIQVAAMAQKFINGEENT